MNLQKLAIPRFWAIVGAVMLLNTMMCYADSEVPSQRAWRGCGDLAGSCNDKICCCSSGGVPTQKPSEDGQCRWDYDSGIGGSVFLALAGLLPAIASYLLFRFTTPLSLKLTSELH
jgi:hypothetical protein